MTADGFNSDRDAEMVRDVHATGVRMEAVLDQLQCEQRQTGERVAAAQRRVLELAETVDTLSALTARLTADNLRLVGENAALRALLAECIDKLPGWAGVNDDAHGWYCRAKTALSLRPWEIPAPPLLDEQEGE